MKAVRLERAAPLEGHPLRLVELDAPEPGPGEVRLRVRACGVCRTDLLIAEGEVPSAPPLVLGHQVVGVVDRAGAGARRFKSGDRLGVAWLYGACGECARCAEGLENLCAKARFTGLTAPGGWAQALTVPEAFAHPIPARYSDAEAAPLLCAGAVGWRAWRFAHVRPGERVGLYGFGSSAHIVLQVARHAGAETFVFSRSAAHRKLAGSLGAFWTGEVSSRLPFPLDAAIVFAPAGRLVPEALGHLRPGGRLVLAGIHMSEIPPMPYSLLWGERSIRSVANVTREDVRQLLHEADRFRLRVRTQTFPLEAASEALAAIKEGRAEASVVLDVDARAPEDLEHKKAAQAARAAGRRGR